MSGSESKGGHVTVHYFFEFTSEVRYMLSMGSVFTSAKGEPLNYADADVSVDAIRLALRLDGEVWSR